MAYGQMYQTLAGFKANSTGLAASQFKVVKLASTAGQVVLSGALNTTTAATTIFGVLQNSPAGSEEAEVAIDGICKIKVATSTIAIGDRVGVNSTSLGTDAGSGDNAAFMARALTASAAVNDVITVILQGVGGGRY